MIQDRLPLGQDISSLTQRCAHRIEECVHAIAVQSMRLPQTLLFSMEIEHDITL